MQIKFSSRRPREIEIKGVEVSADRNSEVRKSLRAIVDTGSTHSHIPADVAETVELCVNGLSANVRYADGSSEKLPFVIATISVPGLGSVTMPALASQGDELLLGMDYLRRFRTLLTRDVFEMVTRTAKLSIESTP